MPNPTDTARALVDELENATKRLTLAEQAQSHFPIQRAMILRDEARAALLAHVAGVEQQLARYKEIYESNSAAFIAIRKAFGIEADETVVPYILKYAPPLATRPTEARDA